MALKDKNVVGKLKTTTKKVVKIPKGFFGLILNIGRYFKNSWLELKQVRWPNRRATWGLTLAVLIFTGFFVTLILLLDNLFNYLFNLILK